MPPGWSQTRKRQLDLEPRCEWRVDAWRCPEPATDVDHVVNRAAGGGEVDNYQSLCHKHHMTKTAAEGHAAYKEQVERTRSRFQRNDPHPGLVQ